MSRIINGFTAAAFALAALTLATPALSAAVNPLYSSVGGQVFGNGIYVNQYDTKQDSSEARVEASGATYDVLARAQTDFGINKAYAAAATTGVYVGSVYATSSWMDFLTITEGGKSGAGTVRYQFRVDGTAVSGPGGGDSASANFQVYHDGSEVRLSNVSGSIFETSDLPFTYGEAFSLQTDLSVNVAYNGVADFFNTLELVSITPAGAEGAQLSTEFGGESFAPVFKGNAAAAVPEANTFALALPALVMVGAVVIKRRKK